MANTLGTKVGTLIAQRTIDYLREMLPPALRYYVDFGNEGAVYNQTTTARIPAVGAAYDASSGYSAPDVTDTDRSVQVNKWKSASFAFTVAELNGTTRNLVEEHAPLLANTLATAFLADLAAVFVTAAGYNDTEEAATAYDKDTVRAARKRLNVAKAPPTGRVAFINADAYEALTGDARVVSIDNNPSAHNQFVEAPSRLRVGGFDVQEYPNLPDNSQDMNGVFMAPGAVIGVTGIPNDANLADFPSDAPATAMVRRIAAPMSEDSLINIPLLLRETKTQAGGFQMDLTMIYGFAKGQTACGERIVEPAS